LAAAAPKVKAILRRRCGFRYRRRRLPHRSCRVLSRRRDNFSLCNRKRRRDRFWRWHRRRRCKCRFQPDLIFCFNRFFNCLGLWHKRLILPRPCRVRRKVGCLYNNRVHQLLEVVRPFRRRRLARFTRSDSFWFRALWCNAGGHRLFFNTRRLLRVRPETLRRITEFSEHESDGGELEEGELEEGERVAVEVFPVPG
jgi:hypothetical protein